MTNKSPEPDLMPQTDSEPQIVSWRNNALYPSGFAEFVEVHGSSKTLPDFKPLAHQALTHAAENPDDLTIVWLDRGIGKTTVFATALEEVAARQGGRLLGQIAPQPKFVENIGLDPYIVQRFQYFDSIDKNSSSPITIETPVEFSTHNARSKKDYISLSSAYEESPHLDSYLQNQIWQRFSQAHVGDVFLIDEVEALAYQHPDLVRYISALATNYGVMLVGTAIVVEPFFTQKDAEIDISQYINEQESTQKDRLVSRATVISGRKSTILHPEQPVLVPESAIRLLAKDFNLEPEYIERLLIEPDIRRLRVFEQLVNYLALRNNEPKEEHGRPFGEADIRGLFDYSNAVNDRAFGPASKDYRDTSSTKGDLEQYGLSHIGLKRVSTAITGRVYNDWQ